AGLGGEPLQRPGQPLPGLVVAAGQEAREDQPPAVDATQEGAQGGGRGGIAGGGRRSDGGHAGAVGGAMIAAPSGTPRFDGPHSSAPDTPAPAFRCGTLFTARAGSSHARRSRRRGAMLRGCFTAKWLLRKERRGLANFSPTKSERCFHAA